MDKNLKALIVGPPMAVYIFIIFRVFNKIFTQVCKLLIYFHVPVGYPRPSEPEGTKPDPD